MAAPVATSALAGGTESVHCFGRKRQPSPSSSSRSTAAISSSLSPKSSVSRSISRSSYSAATVSPASTCAYS
ncbi:hypothetical protein Dsin_005309 [Dipteronia sinensis]|uniref:Uncharacterized protein n=1 Tax=Dipteronia sinensis TaxID=43782 RepID=A0AAE0AXK5_9ROSI|nr:hypothetical protein Dsin_005309 [Dipteronia sinensis]